MIHLIYVSSSVKPFSDDELLQLLKKSRQKNDKLGITGMLLYKDGDFMQALEGDEVQVRKLSEQIAKDPRHRDFSTLLTGPCVTREFPDWSMGFRNLSAMDTRYVPGYSAFLDSPLRALAFTNSPALCREFLVLFKTMPNVR